MKESVKFIIDEILSMHEDARADDDILYYYICEYYNSSVCELPLREFLMNRNRYGVPPYETVRRSRQLVLSHQK